MSKRNYESREDNALRRASTDKRYSERERALIGIIAELMKKIPYNEWGVITENEHIKSIIKWETSLEKKLSDHNPFWWLNHR